MPIGKTPINRGLEVSGEVRRRFPIRRMEDLGGTGGGYERGNDQSHHRFDGRWKTRGGGLPDRYGQKRHRMAADRPTGRIVGGGRVCCRRSNGDGNGNGDIGGYDDDDGRGMGGSSCDARTRLGLRSRSPRSSVRKRSRGTNALGASTTRSRSGLRSGLGLISCRRRLWGEWSGRSGGDGGRNRKYDGRDNDDDRNIGDCGEDVDDGG